MRNALGKSMPDNEIKRRVAFPFTDCEVEVTKRGTQPPYKLGSWKAFGAMMTTSATWRSRKTGLGPN